MPPPTPPGDTPRFWPQSPPLAISTTFQRFPSFCKSHIGLLSAGLGTAAWGIGNGFGARIGTGVVGARIRTGVAEARIGTGGAGVSMTGCGVGGGRTGAVKVVITTGGASWFGKIHWNIAYETEALEIMTPEVHISMALQSYCSVDFKVMNFEVLERLQKQCHMFWKFRASV